MKKREYAALGGLFVLLCLGVLGYIYLQTFLSPPATIDGEPLRGELLLTLQNAGTQPDVYTYAFGSYAPLSFFANNRHNITAALSHDHASVAYMSREQDTAFQLYVVAADKTKLRQVTNDANRYKREPVWNHAGDRLAYMVQPEGSGRSLSSPDSWLVFLTDLSGETLAVVSGTNPFFSPDDETLFVLRSTGIHAVDLTQLAHNVDAKTKVSVPEAVLVVPTISNPKKIPTRSMKLSVSPDGRRLVWSVPREGFVRVFTISQWSPLMLRKDVDLPVAAFYSAFSPDSQFVALQQVNLNAMGETTRPRIVVYKLSNYHSSQVLDLSAYNPNFMWLTGWR